MRPIPHDAAARITVKFFCGKVIYFTFSLLPFLLRSFPLPFSFRPFAFQAPTPAA
jgi:hypothetical protein